MHQALVQILGLPNDSESWPHSEEALVELIHLHQSKEATKQQYYKSENLKLSISLVERCERLGISPQMIPHIFTGDLIASDQDYSNNQRPTTSAERELQQHFSHQRTYSVPPQFPSDDSSSYRYPPRPQHTHTTTSSQQQHHQHQQQHQQHHQNQRFLGPPQQQQQQHHQNQRILGPPVMFTPTTMLSPTRNTTHSNATNTGTRPTSPAKVGAAAVAKLDKPTPSYNHSLTTSRHTRFQHKRNQSMPSASLRTSDQGMGSMMGVINPIQFINETPPAVKRSHHNITTSQDSSSMDSYISGSSATSLQTVQNDENKPPGTTFLFESGLEYKPHNSHKRTKSDHISTGNTTTTTFANSNKALINDITGGTAATAGMNHTVRQSHNNGPKFANDILG
ncbi:hypothetical protein WICPIJ_001557 [Wickerhamomyces pijperi]|uniref:Uncharacterized protein n=1 Tax=Wickerhamomyces pijperi TaxID=599730 RepID=A0A9P8QD97_WICPI|nr:hypothetical protein WICPIJ_001557 [Wickerhamomyces pijperi]